MNRKREILFWLFVVGQLTAGAALLYRPLAVAPDFSRALAHALIIAGLLAFTVDLYLKAKLLREVAGDVSKFLVGYSLPIEVRDRIQDLMHETMIRRDYLLRLRLVPTSESERSVKLYIEVSDEVVNISNETRPYVDYIEYEKHEKLTVTEMRCDSEDSKAQYFLSGHGLAKDADPGLLRASGKRVKIVPHNDDRKLTYRFTAKWEIIVPEKYSDIISFSRPTINARVEVECPPEFWFAVSPVADVSHRNVWEYRRLFLPHQHLRYRWETMQTHETK